MASGAQDRLFELFLEIAGEPAQGANPVLSAGQELADVLKDVTRTIEAALPPAVLAPRSTVSPAAAVVAPAASGDDGGGVLGFLEDAASAVFKSGLGAAPLLRAILSFFGGDDDPEPPKFTKFTLPPAIHFTAASTDAGLTLVDFDQQGLPRAFEQPEVEVRAARVPVQQVTVNVQALDARSLLDRSSDIAAAVREAMLHANSINDVVSDL